MLKYFRIITVILLIAWMTMIFSLSSQNADQSSQTSGGVIATVVRIFYPDFDALSEAQQLELIEPFQFIVRKSAHFTAYAVLGALSFLSVITFKKIPLFYRSGISAAICLLYSVSDEIHQTFVKGRSGEVRDVCIDFCGSLLAIVVFTLIVKKSKFKFLKNLA